MTYNCPRPDRWRRDIADLWAGVKADSEKLVLLVLLLTSQKRSPTVESATRKSLGLPKAATFLPPLRPTKSALSLKRNTKPETFSSKIASDFLPLLRAIGLVGENLVSDVGHYLLHGVFIKVPLIDIEEDFIILVAPLNKDLQDTLVEDDQER